MSKESVRLCVVERRPFVRGAGWLALGAMVSSVFPIGSVLAQVTSGAPRTLSFHSLHTGERLEATYWAQGAYRPEALAQLNHIMRDWRTSAVTDMDPKLLDLLYELRRRVDSSETYQIISAYRSPTTNAALANKSGGVARKSLHIHGMAIDVDLPDRQLAVLRDVALELRRGGVGYYPKPGFVHLDTGRVRSW